MHCPRNNYEKKFILGSGSEKAKIMFIGDVPGIDAERTIQHFSGQSGELLTKIIESINLKRNEVFLTTIIKCCFISLLKDSDDNSCPSFDEINACLPYLEKQIQTIKPVIICALGNCAVQSLLKTEAKIKDLRGTFVDYKGIKLMPTYHPADLIKNVSLKKDVWEDMKLIRDALKK